MDFRNVLVYTDGRPACERALTAGAAVARQGGGKLTVLHVVEPPLPVPKLDAAIAQALESSQLEELDRLRSLAQTMGVEARCEARKGRPFVEIIRACQREGSHLVVKAARGRGRLGWPLLGSTALHLVRKCPAPVWLVGEEGEPLPRRVMALLASDPASEERQALDRRVLEVACSLVEATGAELSVGAAWDAPGESLLRRRMPEEKLREYVENARRQAEEGLGRALEPFGTSVNPTRVHLVRGLPYVELVGLAAQRADLAVVGTTPSSGGAAFLIREEAEEVVNRLETAIVAVKPEGFVSPVNAS
jgi:nucleotide-binding universal stress UspA family protein